MNHNLEDFLAMLLDGKDLLEDQSEELMTAMTEGEVEPALAGALLVALRMKGESAEEVRGFANGCLLYTSPSPRDRQKSRMPSSA